MPSRSGEPERDLRPVPPAAPPISLSQTPGPGCRRPDGVGPCLASPAYRLSADLRTRGRGPARFLGPGRRLVLRPVPGRRAGPAGDALARLLHGVASAA